MIDRRMLGAVRPGPRWRKYDVSVLRLSRLASDTEAEADRHPDDSAVRADVEAAARILRHAAQLATEPAD